METADTDLADAATEREGRIGAAMRGRRGAVSGQAETEGIEEARHLCEYLPQALQASRSCKYPCLCQPLCDFVLCCAMFGRRCVLRPPLSKLRATGWKRQLSAGTPPRT